MNVMIGHRPKQNHFRRKGVASEAKNALAVPRHFWQNCNDDKDFWHRAGVHFPNPPKPAVGAKAESGMRKGQES
jgi:hypothetical protein